MLPDESLIPLVPVTDEEHATFYFIRWLQSPEETVETVETEETAEMVETVETVQLYRLKI